jgi:hypothetical protein
MLRSKALGVDAATSRVRVMNDEAGLWDRLGMLVRESVCGGGRHWLLVLDVSHFGSFGGTGGRTVY